MKLPTSLKKFIATTKPLRNKICLLMLFGSYARGDYDKDSDIDLLVVSKSDDKVLREKVMTLVEEAMETVGYREMLSPTIMDLKHFNKIKKMNTDLYYFLNREGKILWQAPM